MTTRTLQGSSDCTFCEIINGASDVMDNNIHTESRYGVPYESRNFVAFPDGAPLSQGHTLLAPKSHNLSFSRLSETLRDEAIGEIHYLKNQLCKKFSNATPYFFEHGSTEADETLGCSTTHAHFHLLFVEDESLFCEWNGSGDFIKYPNISEVWTQMGEHDYYLFGRFGASVFAHTVIEDPSLKCRMFLRKLFANRMEQPDVADYLRFSQPEPRKGPLRKHPVTLYNQLDHIDQYENILDQVLISS